MADPTVETLNKPNSDLLLYRLIIPTPDHRQALDFGNSGITECGRFNQKFLTHFKNSY